jgi:diadenosine tetraphosphatase ApaH/serine/threonine PP2A family protein phosphatase
LNAAMKYAVFGDIHANWEALEAVLADASAMGCTEYVCLGDVVGYNANPRECLQKVQEMGCPVVKGNHDEEASVDTSLEGLNPLAARALHWTRDSLTTEDRQWLRDLKLVRQVRDFTIVHATLDTPAGWSYVTNKFDAMASFSYQFTQLCFHGHTHTPRFYVKHGSVEAVAGEETELGRRLQILDGSKYFVNVGSVGQPRDGDWRAAYAVYDLSTRQITIRRLEYDLQTAQEKILGAGLPEMLANRLAIGK